MEKISVAKCGGYKNSAEWAKNDPEGLIKAVNQNEKTAALVNKAGPGKLKNFMRAVGKDALDPFGWIGGDIIFSTMFSAEAEKRGKTPLEALDEGVLWFLPKGVIDAQKKALFGYEGTPSGAYKMEGYAGAYDTDQISDMKNFLDMEDSDRKYWAAKNEKEAFEKAGNIEGITHQQYKNNIERLDSDIEKYGNAANDSVMKIYERNTGLQTEDGTPIMKEMYQEDFAALLGETGKNLWDVQQQYAIDEINRSKQGDLNTLYAKREGTVPGIFDVIAKGTPGWIWPKGTHELGITEKGQLPFGMGPTGNISTAITDPYDIYRASSPLKASERLPAGIKQGWQKVLDLWNMGLISQEEKEQYAIDMGREDLLYKEYKHPIYGPSYSYDQIKKVYPEYFEGAIGGRAGYMGGGITGIRKPSAIPPEKQGLRSIMINGKKS